MNLKKESIHQAYCPLLTASFPPINNHALKALSKANPPQNITTRRKPATNDSLIACLNKIPVAGSTLAGTSAAANLVRC